MPATSRNPLEFIERGLDLHQPVAIAKDNADGSVCPAMALQHFVEQAYSASYPEPHVTKWPAPVRLFILSGLCVTTWSLIIIGVRTLL